MEQIKRDIYLNRLIERKENGMIKVITGIRKCGKSYLLFELYYQYLLNTGVDASRIILIALNDSQYGVLHDRDKLDAYIKAQMTDDNMWYIFIDDIQMCEGFEDILNSLNKRDNVDIYVTSSYSQFLVADVSKEFNQWGDEVRVYPLSFSEYVAAYPKDPYDAWADYCTYGGLPLILTQESAEQKAQYLATLWQEAYLKDMMEHHGFNGRATMTALAKSLALAVGVLTNPYQMAKATARLGRSATNRTIDNYINCLVDAFLISRAGRYNLNKEKPIGSPLKYYFLDIGLRNALLDFKQQDDNPIIENIIYNELLVRGFGVDFGIVVHNIRDESRKKIRKHLKVNFDCKHGNRRYYIQVLHGLSEGEEMQQKQEALLHITDSAEKIILINDNITPKRNEEGITIMGIMDFLLNPNSLER